MLDKLYDDVGMMQIYRLDHGEDVIGNVVKREEEQTLNEQEIALSKQLLSTFGNRIEEIAAKNGENPLSVKKSSLTSITMRLSKRSRNITKALE